MEGLELEPGVWWDFPSAQWPSLPYWRWGLIPSCWRRSCEGWPELALFPLSVCFSLSPHWDPCPRAGEGQSKWGSCELLVCIGHRQRSNALPVQTPVVLPCHSFGCKSSLSLTAGHCPQPLLPLLCCRTTLQGRWGLCGISACIRVSCGGVAALRDLGCFCGTIWVSANNGHHHPTQTLPWD